MEIPNLPGSYVIVGNLASEVDFAIKSLANLHFVPGIYCYCGSAYGPGGLRARIKRHLTKNTKKFWHFDYFKGYLDIIEIWWQAGGENDECKAARLLADEAQADVPVKGFGASDCHNACQAHLVYFPNGTYLDTVFQNLSQHGLNLDRKRINYKEIG